MPSSERLPHTTGWDHNALMFISSEKQFIFLTKRGSGVPNFTFASAVKYIVDIELLVLHSIFRLAYCNLLWSGVAKDLVHLA